jgi:hypothetical protein
LLDASTLQAVDGVGKRRWNGERAPTPRLFVRLFFRRFFHVFFLSVHSANERCLKTETVFSVFVQRCCDEDFSNFFLEKKSFKKF